MSFWSPPPILLDRSNGRIDSNADITSYSFCYYSSSIYILPGRKTDYLNYFATEYVRVHIWIYSPYFPLKGFNLIVNTLGPLYLQSSMSLSKLIRQHKQFCLSKQAVKISLLLWWIILFQFNQQCYLPILKEKLLREFTFAASYCFNLKTQIHHLPKFCKMLMVSMCSSLIPQLHGADSWKCIDKQCSKWGPKSAQKPCCLKVTCICAENSWQWVWFFFLPKLMNPPCLHWIQGAWQAVAECQDPLLMWIACKGSCQLHGLPSKELCTQKKTVVLSGRLALCSSEPCVCRPKCLQDVNVCWKHTVCSLLDLSSA